MEQVRRNGMIDINAALEQGLIQYNEAEVHGARKNKFWFNNYTWMYKEVDNDYNTYEEYAEVICYELSKLLSIRSAEYDLASFKGKKGVITRSVINDSDKLIHGTELLNEVYEDYFVLKQTLHKSFKNLLEQYHRMNPKILYKQQILLLSPVRQNVSSYHRDHSIYLVFLLFRDIRLF